MVVLVLFRLARRGSFLVRLARLRRAGGFLVGALIYSLTSVGLGGPLLTTNRQI